MLKTGSSSDSSSYRLGHVKPARAHWAGYRRGDGIYGEWVMEYSIERSKWRQMKKVGTGHWALGTQGRTHGGRDGGAWGDMEGWRGIQLPARRDVLIEGEISSWREGQAVNT